MCVSYVVMRHFSFVAVGGLPAAVVHFLPAVVVHFFSAVIMCVPLCHYGCTSGAVWIVLGYLGLADLGWLVWVLIE